MEDRWYALPSDIVRRVIVVLLGVTLFGVAACGGHTQSKADQGKAIAEQAGLAPDVASFFALATAGSSATYRATVETTDTTGKALQLTTTQRPPDSRFDAFHADGSVDSTINVSGHSYQCTMAANHWDCGDLGVTPTTSAATPAARTSCARSWSSPRPSSRSTRWARRGPAARPSAS